MEEGVPVLVSEETDPEVGVGVLGHVDCFGVDRVAAIVDEVA